MGTTTNIADGVVAILTSAPEGTFAKEFNAARTWLPEQQLADLQGVVLRVIPRTSEETLSSRTMVENSLGLDVVVMSKLGAVTNDNVDEMVALVDQIKAFLRFKSPSAGVSWASAASPTICSVDALREFMQFTGQFTLTYRYMEGRA